MTQRITQFLKRRSPETPCLIVDLNTVKQNYRKLSQALPDAAIYYAVKANPAPQILKLLTDLGCAFDVASVGEIELVLQAGADASRMSYGNTIKKQADIAKAYTLGVRLFAFDCMEELEKIAQVAPGSRVFCRILTSGEGAQWPLSRKFGCHPQIAVKLLRRAQDLGLKSHGISFHVGSQQLDPRQWNDAVATAAGIFRTLEDHGITLEMLNIGGGMPTRYRQKIPSLCAYGAIIRDAIRTHFGNRLPDVIAEPGRQLVGDAGIIQTEVVLIGRKAPQDLKRWVYLDIGKFGGLAETQDEAIQYPICSGRKGRREQVILAGPTCDSADVLYEKAKYRLPVDLEIGDKLLIKSTGAYTSTYSSVAFNGFSPLRCYCI